MDKLLRAALFALGVTALAIVPATGAAAAPTNAANQLTGSADCGDDGAFTFVVTVNSGRGNGWNPAFITSSDGDEALFIPSAFDLTFTSPEGTDSEQIVKGATSGAVSCEIFASPAPGFTLTGTVTGTIIWAG
jgi:hypothetical protein